MEKLQLVHNYQNNEEYRQAFNKLTKTIFGFNFENWYQKNYWNDRYLPYSYMNKDGEIISNVSVNEMDLIIGGKKRKAIQIGTVMTHPDYRGKGLAAKLMNVVMQKYQEEVDFFYLFANKSVLDFYPKFGFQSSIKETVFSIDINPDDYIIDREPEKLETSKQEELDRIYKLASQRQPISNEFGIDNGQDLVMFYCLYVFGDNVYYLEEDDTIVICKKSNNVLHLYDLISYKNINFKKVVGDFIDEEVEKIVFHFTPDLLEIEADSKPLINEDDTLFIKGDFTQDKNFKCPITGHA